MALDESSPSIRFSSDEVGQLILRGSLALSLSLSLSLRARFGFRVLAVNKEVPNGRLPLLQSFLDFTP